MNTNIHSEKFPFYPCTPSLVLLFQKFHVEPFRDALYIYKQVCVCVCVQHIIYTQASCLFPCFHLNMSQKSFHINTYKASLILLNGCIVFHYMMYHNLFNQSPVNIQIASSLFIINVLLSMHILIHISLSNLYKYIQSIYQINS